MTPAVHTGTIGKRHPPPGRGDPIRCLFINWKDGTPPSQFTVPDDYTLERRGLTRRRRPERLTIFETTANAELYLETRLIKSCYLVDVGADQRVTIR